MPSSGTETALVEVVMPQMGVSVSEGTIVAWHKAVGEDVAYEEPICEISTDKINSDVPAAAAGTVAEILVEADETVAVGTVLARIAPTGSEAPASAAPPTAETTPPTAPPPAEAAAAGPPRRRPRLSPVVRRLAAEHELEVGSIAGSGLGGRVTKKDVLAHLESRPAPAAAPPRTLHGESPYVPEPAPAAPAPTAPAGLYQPPPPQPLSPMRVAIGANMKRSQVEAATCTSWMEVDMTAVEAARRTRGVTALAYVSLAAIEALREFPALNAWLDEEGRTLHSEVNLGVAVSLGDEGLVVPVIHAAQTLSVDGLAARIRDLGERGRAGRLSPDDLHGGTFTVSNAGRHGALMATPIINRPQVAILGVESIAKRPVVRTDPDGVDSIAIRVMTVLGMSWDHRALDGVLASQFLSGVKRRLEAVAA